MTLACFVVFIPTTHQLQCQHPRWWPTWHLRLSAPQPPSPQWSFHPSTSTTHPHSNTVDPVCTNNYSTSKSSNSRMLLSNPLLISFLVFPLQLFFSYNETSSPWTPSLSHYRWSSYSVYISLLIVQTISLQTPLTLSVSPFFLHYLAWQSFSPSYPN